MAKQPEGISLLGKDLIRQAQTRSDTAARKAAKREEKAALIGAGFEAFKSIGNKVLAKKNEDFLQQEGFYAKNAIFQANLKEDQSQVSRWDNRLSYEGGEDKYWRDMAQAHISSLPGVDGVAAGKSSSESEYLKYTESVALASKMKKNAEENYKVASGRMQSYGENPENFYKNQALKDRADNVWDAISLPIVNLFGGKDTRPTTQVLKASAEKEGGIIDQGLVNKEIVDSIYLQRGDYTFALREAEEATKFLERYSGLIAGLSDKVTYGDLETVQIMNPNGDGTTLEISAREKTQGNINMGYVLPDGTNVKALMDSADSTKRARSIPQEIKDEMSVVYNTLTSPADKDFMSNYMESITATGATDADKKNISNNTYGNMAIAAGQLHQRFKDLPGWNSEISQQLGAQMIIEDAKLSYSDGGYLSAESYDPNKSLLQGNNKYNPLVAGQALQTLMNKGNIRKSPETQKMLNIFKTEGLDLLNTTNLTGQQSGSIISLMQKLSIVLPTAPPSPDKPALEAQVEEVLAPVVTTEEEVTLPLPPKQPDSVKARRKEPLAAREQRKEYMQVLKAQKTKQFALDNSNTQSGPAGFRAQQQQERTIKYADSVYADYMKKYGA